MIVEPSVLALFRYDYKKLINNDNLFNKLAKHTYDPFEYLNKIISNGELELANKIDSSSSSSVNIFYHPHCQMKTIGVGSAAIEFFSRLGFTMDVSDVECCGMAGSFGYKKEYYDISRNIGEDLIKQIQKSNSLNKQKIILASGTSCREQIADQLDNVIYHPILS